ncbi:MAG: hypothetical protein ACU0BS_04805 [Hasllibacter sp.]
MERASLILAAVAAVLTGPALADARSVINGITYEALSDDPVRMDASDGIVRVILGEATVTVTRAGTFIGVARVAGRPRDTLRLSEGEGGLSVSVDGVVVWSGDAG